MQEEVLVIHHQLTETLVQVEIQEMYQEVTVLIDHLLSIDRQDQE